MLVFFQSYMPIREHRLGAGNLPLDNNKDCVQLENGKVIKLEARDYKDRANLPFLQQHYSSERRCNRIK